MPSKENNIKEPALAVHGLSVTLNRVRILDKVSFSVNAGENLIVIGPNGSGKTTLFKAIMGFIPYHGEVHWASGAKIGYVPQKLDIERSLPLSLQDFLESKGSGFIRVTQADIKHCMDEVRLEKNLLQKPLGALSGGEFQRALVAFALLGDPNILLFDEPTAGVDFPGEEQIYETLHRLQDEKNITILTISHDLSLVYRYATTVLCLNKRNVCFGAPKETLTQETLAELYGSEPHYYHHIHDHH